MPVDNPLPKTDLASALAEVMDSPPALTPEQLAAHPMAQEQYEFTVEIVDGGGRKLGGKFKNRILSPDEKGRVGLLIAKLTKGAIWVTLDPDTQYIYTMMAHLALSLAEMPKDFSITGTKNTRLLEAVYREVAAHESYFLGPPPAPPAGDS